MTTELPKRMRLNTKPFWHKDDFWCVFLCAVILVIGVLGTLLIKHSMR